ncbi:MAG: hypothetical protein AAF288_12900 [Planctomycetota bacterium]
MRRVVEVTRDEAIHVRKHALPLAVVIEDEDGNYQVQALHAAGKKKLGARIGEAPALLVGQVRRLLRR